MAFRATLALLFVLSLFRGCSHLPSRPQNLASGPPPQTLAVYEAWFGHPRHITISYSSHDEAALRRQIQEAKSLGIAGFVVDWYGYREPFIDRSYGLMQKLAAEGGFKVAMMYDESDEDEGATDGALEDFKLFNKNYLAADAPGRQAYLTYQGRPVIFIFPKGKHTDWSRVRAEVDKWDKPPLLIDEFPPGADAAAMDGYYPWVSPGEKGWAADGSNWGQQYLDGFYATMQQKYPEKIALGGAWALFDDGKAAWGLNRHIAPRCGQTLADTLGVWKKYSATYYMPFLLVGTWNDYEEGTAIEPGIPGCDGSRHPAQLR